MILLVGIPSEPPLRMVADALDDLGQPFLILNQRQISRCCFDFEIADGAVEGVITVEGRQVSLGEIEGVYVRAMDETQLPELRRLPFDASARQHSRAQHEALFLWLDLTAARVANRPAANGSNASKPWQARLIEAAGLRTPETLITNDPESVLAFVRLHGEVIYKSASGFRSVVRQFRECDEERLADVRWCPVQFQRRVQGRDVRVHVVGSEVLATGIDSAAVDYRYASRDGLAARLSEYELPPEIAAACRRLSRDLDLPFAGIDLRITEDGQAWCFEVNPCPGFSYYESHTGQPIAAALARYLVGATGSPVEPPVPALG